MKRELILTKDGSHSFFVEEINETYHSKHGAIEESLHVFIKNGLHYYLNNNINSEISILEISFGTGLNALLTFLETTNLNIRINYVTIEPFPLSMDEVNKLNYIEIISKNLTKNTDLNNNLNFKKIYNYLHEGNYSIWKTVSNKFTFWKEKTKIEDLDFKKYFKKFDIIYYDAFAPNKQPSMWETNILLKIISTLKDNGILVTYCSKGEFRREMEYNGLFVQKIAGPHGKKHMTRIFKYQS